MTSYSTRMHLQNKMDSTIQKLEALRNRRQEDEDRIESMASQAARLEEQVNTIRCATFSSTCPFRTYSLQTLCCCVALLAQHNVCPPSISVGDRRDSMQILELRRIRWHLSAVWKDSQYIPHQVLAILQLQCCLTDPDAKNK